MSGIYLPKGSILELCSCGIGVYRVGTGENEVIADCEKSGVDKTAAEIGRGRFRASLPRGEDSVIADEIKRLRWAAIASGNIPEILTTEEAAFVYGARSKASLLKSDVPRSYPPGRTGRPGDPIWLYSQLKLHAEKHLTHRLDAETVKHRVRRFA